MVACDSSRETHGGNEAVEYGMMMMMMMTSYESFVCAVQPPKDQVRVLGLAWLQTYLIYVSLS
jgi:hypothetical protein